MARLAQVFAPGWKKVWRTLETRFRPLELALRDTHDFLQAAQYQALDQAYRAALERRGIATSSCVCMDAPLVPETEGLTVESLGLAWLCRRGPRSLLEASRRWHAQPIVEQVRGPDYGMPATVPTILGELALPEGRAREILTQAALIIEGETMHHCVGSYWVDCALRATRIVHLEATEGESATAQYESDEGFEPPKFVLAALRGPYNREPGTAMRQLAKHIEKAMNAPERGDQRARALRDSYDAEKSYERATEEVMEARVRPRPLRLLDAQSQRELRLVLDWCLRQKDWRARTDELFRGRIAGFRYADGPRLLDRLDAGDPLQLVREPYNPHDPLAVRVDWCGHKLGYVPRTENAPIARRLDADVALTATILAVRLEDDAWSPVEFVITPEPVPNSIEE